MSFVDDHAQSLGGQPEREISFFFAQRHQQRNFNTICERLLQHKFLLRQSGDNDKFKTRETEIKPACCAKGSPLGCPSMSRYENSSIMNMPSVTKSRTAIEDMIKDKLNSEIRTIMQIWAVVYNPAAFSEELYQRGILLVDPESRTRIQRFYRREDACRTLIGRLLPRMLLKQRGIPPGAMTFAYTQTGKPYITTTGIEPIGFNLAHDNALIVMAFAPGEYGHPSFDIGIDVMKVERPNKEPFHTFIAIMRSQLATLEHDLLLAASPEQALRLFFWIWTLKEAYTKALGLGLGFDFTRIEYNVPEDVVLIDGKIPEGWRFTKFELYDGNDLYQGVVAEFVGGNATEFLIVDGKQLFRQKAECFVQQAIQVLE